MRKFLLLSLLAGIAVVIWQLTAPLIAAEPPQGRTRQEVISEIQNGYAKDGAPTNEINQRIAAANQIWDAAEAKGLDTTTTYALVGDVMQKNIAMIPGIASEAQQVINNTDFSNVPIHENSKGLLISNISIAQYENLPPSRVQEMTKTLIEVASDPKVPQDNLAASSMILGAVAQGVAQGLSDEQAKQRGNAVVTVAEQLSAQGLSGEQISSGLVAATNSIGQNASPEEAVRVANISINAIGAGASEAATFSTSETITAAVKTSGDAQTVASAAIGAADEAIKAQQSSLAGEVAGTTTGNAMLNNIPVDQANQMGRQAGEMVAQLEQQFGALPAAAAGETISTGIIKQEDPQLVENAAELAVTKAVEIQNNGGSPSAMQLGGELVGSGILAGQTQEEAFQVADVGVAAYNNQIENGEGMLFAEQSADAAVSDNSQSSGDAEHAPPQGEADKYPQQESPDEDPIVAPALGLQQGPSVVDPNATSQDP